MDRVSFSRFKEKLFTFSNRKLLIFLLTSFSGLLFSTLTVIALVAVFSPQTISKELDKIPFITLINKSSGQVLQAATRNPAARLSGEISFNLPATFNEKILVNSDATIKGTLTAPNIIYGLVAGDNITISEGQNPTISVNVDGLTTEQNVFGNIKVGSTTIPADAVDDTFELAAGDNITLSTDTTNKKITINGASSGISGITVQEGDTTLNTASTIDFLGGDFDLTDSPSGEANIALASILNSVTGVAGSFSVGGGLTVGGDTISDFIGTNTGLEVSGGTLTLLTSCNDNEILKYSTGVGWICATDSGGGGGGISTVQVNDVSVGASFDTLDFSSLFSVTASPANEANVTIANDAIGDTQLAFNTGQNLTTASSPTFSGLTLTSLTVNSDTINDFTGTGLTMSGNSLTTTLGTSIDLASAEVTGTLGAGNGGTGTTSFGGTNTILYTTATDTLAAITTGNNGVLITSAGGVPSISSTLPNAVQDNITRLGTVTLGTWNGTIIAPTYGGTGDDTSGTTGVPYISAGNWQYEAQLSGSRGGTGADLSAAAQYSIPYFGSTGVMTSLAPGTSGYVLTTNGAGSAPTWTNTATLGTNYWDQVNGTLTPKIETQDLLLGSQATSSARFAVININSGTPVASLSAGIAGGLSITANGTLQTTANQTLTIGGTSTGNIILSPLGGSGLVTSTGSLNLASGKTFQIAGTDVLSSTTLGANVVTSSLTTVSALNSGSITSGFGAIDIGSDNLTAGGTIIFGGLSTNGFVKTTGGTGTLSVSSTVSLASEVSGILGIGNGGSPFEQGNGSIFERITTQDFLLGSQATSSAKFAVTNVGSGTPTASLSAGLAGGLFITANGQLQTTNRQSLTIGGGGTGNIIIGNTGFANCSALETVNGVLTCGTDDTGSAGTNYWQLLGGAISPFSETLDVLFGSTATNSAEFAVTGIAAGTPTATLSATTNGYGISLTASSGTIQSLQNGTLTLGGATTGNIILSPLNGSGIVTSTGSLTLANGKTYQINGTDVLSATALGTNVVSSSLTSVGALNSGSITSGFGAIDIGNDNLTAGGTITFSGLSTNGFVKTTGGTGQISVSSTVNLGSEVSGILAIGNGGSPFEQSGGTIIQRIITQDFLLGSQSTGSARFAVTNVGTGTPTASVSAGVTGGLFISANGQLQTTNRQSLTLGGGGTGNIVIGNTGFTSCSALETVNGVLTCGTDDTGVASTNYWQLINGAISPFSETLDVLIGSTATNSAEFALTGIAAGAPTASLSASTNGNGIYLNASTSTIQSLRNNTLTLGGNTTGNIILDSGTGLISLLDNTTISQDLTVLGGDITGTNGETIDLGEGTDGSIVFTGAGGGNNKNFILDLESNSSYPILSSDDGTIGLNSGLEFVGAQTISGTNNLDFDITGNITLTTNSGSGTLALEAGTLTINGVTGITDGSPQCVTVTKGIVTGTGVCQLGSEQWVVGNGAISTGNPSLDLLLGSSATASSRFAVTNISGGTPTASLSAGVTGGAFLTASGQLQTTNNQSLTIGGNTTGNIILSPLNGSGNVRINGTTTLGGVTYTWPGSIGSNNYILQAQTNGTLAWVDPGTLPASDKWDSTLGAIYPKNASTLDFFIGGTTTTSARFAITGVTTGAPIATLSASTNGNGIVLNASGGNLQSLQNQSLTLGGSTTGNIILSDLTFANAGLTVPLGQTTTLASFTNDGGIIYANSSGVLSQTAAGSSSQCLIGGATPSWSDCSGAAGDDWDFANGALSPKFASVTDLLLGSTSTASAKFAVFNINGSASPVASLSAGITGGIFLTASGQLQTTSNQSLTLGGGATGNIVLPAFTTAGGLLYTNASGSLFQTGSGTVSQCLIGGATPSWTDCGGAAGDDWNFINGALSPKFATVTDLLLGSTATVSAKFAFTNVAGGTPTASISGTGNNALSLDASGTISTTNKQSLTIGNTNTGNIVLGNGNFTTAGGILYTNGSGVLAQTAGGTSAQCLIGGAIPSWSSCAAAASDDWDLINGALSPLYASVTDLLLGSTATTSAKFAFTNVTSGTPTASISGTGNNALSLNGNGILATTNEQTLTLGTASTGDINFVIGTGNNLSINGLAGATVNSASCVTAVNGIVTSSGTCQTGFEPIQVANGAAYLGNTTLDLLIGGTSTTSAKFAFSNVSGGTPTASLSAGAAGSLYLTASGQLQTTNNQSLTIGGSTTGNILIGNGAVDRAGAGISVRGSATDQYVAEFYGRDATYAGFGIFAESNNVTTFLQFGDNSGSSGTPLTDWTLTSTASTGTFDFRSGAANAASVLNLSTGGNLALEGALSDLSDPILSIADNLDIRGNLGTAATASVSGNTAFAGLVVDNRGIGDIFTASTGGVSKFTIQNNGTIVSSNYKTAGGIFYGTSTGAFGLSAAGNPGDILLSNGSGVPTWVNPGTLPSSNFFNEGNGSLWQKLPTEDFLLGGVSTASAKFAFINNAGGTPTASISGTGNNSLSLNGNGILSTTNEQTLTLGTASTGDINFVIGTGNNLSINGLAGATVNSASCVTAVNGIVVSSGVCQTGNEPWQTLSANGTLYTGNTTLDVLVGGVATTSAKFAILNVAGGTPTASLSAGTAGGAFLTANGTLGTTAKQTLTLGNTTTGNLNFAPGGSTAMTILSNGNVGIGTVLPTAMLDVAGAASVSGNITLYGGARTIQTTQNNALTIGGTTTGPITVTGNQGVTVDCADGFVCKFGNNGDHTTYLGSLTGTANTIIQSGGSYTLLETGGVTTIKSDNNGTTAVRFSTSADDLFLLGDATNRRIGIGNMGNSGGSMASLLGTLDVRATSGTLAVATISGRTSSTALVVDNSLGDLFTASSSGLTRFVINNNGNVGIGTSTPARDLEIARTGNSAFMKFNPTGADDWTIGAEPYGFVFYNDTDGGGTYRMVLHESGNIGIGTTSTPDVGTFARGIDITDASAALALTATSGKKFIIGSADSPAGLYFRDQTSAAYRMVIDTNGKIGINTGVSNVLGTLDIRGNTAHQPIASVTGATSFAGLFVDNSVGDIFAASASGISRFRIAQNGNIFTNGVAGQTIGSASCVTTTNGIVTGTGICQSGLEPIQIANGAAYLGNTTLDLLLGSTSTSSALFAVKGIASGTPIATLSASTNNAGIYLDAANSTIQSVRNNTLTLGGNTTGNILLNPKNGTGDIILNGSRIWSGVTASDYYFYSGGDTNSPLGDRWSFRRSGDDTRIRITTGSTGSVAGVDFYQSGQLGFVGFNNNVMYLLANGGNPLALGTEGVENARFTTTARFGIGTTNPLATLQIAPNYAGGGTIAVASTSGRTSFASLIVDNSLGDLFTASASGVTRFTIAQNGNIFTNGVAGQTIGSASCVTTTNGIVTGSGSCQLGTESWQIANGTAYLGNTTLDLLIGGLSSASARFHVFGSPNFSGTNPVASISGNTSGSGLIVDNRVGDIFTASSSGLSRFVIKQNGNVGIGTTLPTAKLQINQGYARSAGLLIKSASAIDAGDSYPFDVQDDGGTSRIQFRNALHQTSISGGNNAIWNSPALLVTTDDSAASALRVIGASQSQTGNLFETYAYYDGNTNTYYNRIFALNPSGTLATATISGKTSFAALVADNTVGDLFTASASGVTRFTIAQNGNIFTNGIAGQTIGGASCVTTTNGIVTGSGSCQLGTESWQIANGTAYLGNTTLDLLLGGTSSSSARFHVFGSAAFAGTTPAASVSANSNSFAGFVVDNRGTGDILSASSSGLTRFVIANNGNVGIGNALPTQKLDIAGNATASGSLSLGGTFQAGVLGATVSYNRLGYSSTNHNLDSSNDLFISGRLEVDGALFIDGSIITAGTTGTVGWFQRNNGAVYPSYITDDLFIGGNSSSSARFHAYGGINTGTTPAASVSANSNSFAGFVVDNRGTGDLFTASSSGLTRFIIANNGEVTARSSSSAGFRVQNTTNETLLAVDTLNSNISLLGNRSGRLTWTTSPNNIISADGRWNHTSVTANGFIYVIGGLDSAEVAHAEVYYARANADGSTGPFQQTTSLPQAFGEHASITTNGYIYVFGGDTNGPSAGGGELATSYYAKINADGTLGRWQSVTSLPEARAELTAVTAYGYAYIIGGTNNNTSVLYTKINPDGTLGQWSSANSTSGLQLHSSVVANGYIYNLGGQGTDTQVLYARINPNTGALGGWQTTTALPAVSGDYNAVTLALNGYLYWIGGEGGDYAQNWYASLNSDGTVGAWGQSPNMNTARRSAAGVTLNGYIYMIGGENGSAIRTVEYASPSRVYVGGSLDLLGFGGATNLASASGGMGGNLTAGNTFIAGLLNVTDNAFFNNGAFIRNALTIDNLFVADGVGTIPAASISARTSFAGLVVDNSGSGDIFSASSSGLARFTIARNGNIYTNGVLGQTITGTPQCVTTTNGIVTGVGTCDTSADPWQGPISGAAYLGNTTLDLLFGGTSTASASLHLYGRSAFQGTQPVASISANTIAAAFIIDNRGGGDLFTASSSGLTRFTIKQNGNLVINGVNYAWPSSIGGSNYILQTSSTGVLTWIDPGSLPNSDKWDSTNGAIYPKNAHTLDLLIGGTATTSAKFAVLNVTGSASPIASLSATTASGGNGNGIVINANGSIQSLRNNTLTLGGDTTGNILVNPLNGTTGGFVGPVTNNVTDLGTSSVAFRNIYAANDIIVAGSSLCRQDGNNCPAGVTNYWSMASGVLFPSSTANATTDLLIGGISTESARFAVKGIASGTPIATISALTNNRALYLDPANSALQSMNMFQLTIGGSTTGTILLRPNNGSGNVGIGTTAPSANFHLVGTNGPSASGENAGNTLTVVGGSGGSGSGIVDAGTGGAISLTSGQGGLGGFSVQTGRDGGNGGALTLAAGAGGNVKTGISFPGSGGDGGDVNISAGNGGNGYAAGSFSNGGNGGSLYLTAGSGSNNADTAGSNGSIYLTTGSGIGTVGNIYLGVTSGGAATGRILVGATGTPLATFDLRAFSNTDFAASMSAVSTRATLLVDNRGTGDLFTASASGQSRFTILNSGKIQLATTEYNNCTALETVNGLLTCGTDDTGPGGSGSSNWTMTASTGVLRPNNNTLDLLIGGTATNSAKFAVLNVAGGTPTATVAGSLVIQPYTTAQGAQLGGTLTVGGVPGFANAVANFGGSVNSYLQVNNQNRSSGGSASTDFIATNDIGTDSSYYIDFGINSSGYNDSAFSIGGANDAYLYNNGGNLAIGTQTGDKIIKFHAGGTTAANEVFRMSGIRTTATASVSGATTFAAMVVNNSGRGDLFTASSSGQTRFTVKQNGAVVINTETNGIVFDYLNGGTAANFYRGSARPQKKITLSPEYAGAILTASGSATITGNITSDASTSANINLGGTTNNFLTYYDWKSTSASLQDYTVAVRVTLPADFDSWAPGGSAMQVVFNTGMATSDTNKMDIRIIPEGQANNGSAPAAYFQNLTSTSQRTWRALNISANDLSDSPAWATASQSAMIYIKMYSKDNAANYVQVGDIILNYLSKF